MDAEYSARILGSVDPMKVKHMVEDQKAEERSHPSYLSLPEQWERQVQAIQRLRAGEAFIRLQDDSVRRVHTMTLPHLTVPRQQLNAVRSTYLKRYFSSLEPPVAPVTQTTEPIIRR